ncbi:MAG: 16S rRNA processing protein RimM [Bacteroidales bacterium]|nr:16S rRNA processing protein RimM [Bacteroidales bacterium]
MIKTEQLIEIGTIIKVHGLKGEMNVMVANAVFDEVKRCPYVVCEMEGIYVPFFIESYRWKGNASILLKLEDVDTMDKANAFCGQKIYFDRRCFSAKEAKAYDTQVEEEMGLIGYTVEDVTLGSLGTITDINDMTANVLFIVNHNGTELMIPAADDLIRSVDDARRTIVMDLPAGLVNMDEAESEDDPFTKI